MISVRISKQKNEVRNSVQEKNKKDRTMDKNFNNDSKT